MRVAIGLMAKAPQVGAVKTRLCPPLSHAQALGAATAMLADCAGSVAAVAADLWCIHTGAAAAFGPHVPGSARMLPQYGDGLAQRLANAQSDLHERGYDRVLLVGADCPTLGPSYLCEAIETLSDHEVVLGAAVDGGYTLIGSVVAQPSLFDVTMSTSNVLRDTLDRARDRGVRPRVLPARTDLDTAQDLVSALEAGWLREAPRTRELAQWVRRLLAGQHGHGGTHGTGPTPSDPAVEPPPGASASRPEGRANQTGAK